MLFWIIVITAVVACIAVACVAVFRNSHNAQVLDRRLARVRAAAIAVYGDPQKPRVQQGKSVSLKGLSSAVLEVFSRLVPVGATERAKLKDSVMKAGFYRPDALSIFMTVKLATALSCGVLLGFQMSAGQWLGASTSTLTILLAGLGGAVVGGMLPEMGLDRLGVRRQRRMAEALPDALDLMTICLESGLTFERTLSRVVNELQPMAPDLTRELNLGPGRTAAWHRPQERPARPVCPHRGGGPARPVLDHCPGRAVWHAAGPVDEEYRPQRAPGTRGADRGPDRDGCQC